jgi:hypothetical protein
MAAKIALWLVRRRSASIRSKHAPRTIKALTIRFPATPIGSMTAAYPASRGSKRRAPMCRSVRSPPEGGVLQSWGGLRRARTMK